MTEAAAKLSTEEINTRGLYNSQFGSYRNITLTKD